MDVLWADRDGIFQELEVSSYLFSQTAMKSFSVPSTEAGQPFPQSEQSITSMMLCKFLSIAIGNCIA